MEHVMKDNIIAHFVSSVLAQGPVCHLWEKRADT